mgnify:CR=1 FL=1
MRKNVVFIGENNKINNELYQLLNWRFKVDYYYPNEETDLGDISVLETDLMIVSMVGTKVDYKDFFGIIKENCPELPVVIISTKDESGSYEEFYACGQFHRILRPVTGRRILEVCRSIIAKADYLVNYNAPDSREPMHILVVDDNAMVLRNIKSILEKNYSVAVAPSGVHAFISIGKKVPDLILLDYEMPEMNGKEVLKRLQAAEEYADIPVIFLTSMDNREIVMELLALKPAGYILKPADSGMLLERIEDIIGK